MRVNFARLAWLLLAVAVLGLLNRDLWVAGLNAAISILLFVAHRIRVRRFAEYDRLREFE
jgi:hypothetical protein